VWLVLASILGATAHARSVNYQSLAATVNGVRIHYLKAGTGKDEIFRSDHSSKSLTAE